MRVVELGRTRVELHEGGLTVTRFADGTAVPALPHDTPEYLERARAHGYGDDVGAMSRDHELTHTVLSYLLTGEPSPVLWRVAHGLPPVPDEDGAEEAAVMSFQRLLRARGGDAVAVAERLR